MNFKTLFEGAGGAGLIAVHVLLAPVLRRRYSRWGATPAELAAHFPGELVRRPKSQITLGITIHAPAEKVWPWFVQLGCRRGGWYSYDLLDNGGTPSAERILPEHQHIQVGDQVDAIPSGAFGFPVALALPGCQLTLAGTLNTATGQPAGPQDPGLEKYFSGNLTFRIDPLSQSASRLVFRQTLDWDPTRLNRVIYRWIMEPISFVMARKMMLNVKRRAEAMV